MDNRNRNYDGILWCKTASGYWINAKSGYQHVYVWEQAHQATVDKGDVIHHINGNKEDNRIENLQLMTSNEHRSLHSKGNKYCLGQQNHLGHLHSNEAKRKMRKKHSISDESRQKMNEIHSGNKYRLGIRHTEETKQKMRESLRRYWANKKASSIGERQDNTKEADRAS